MESADAGSCSDVNLSLCFSGPVPAEVLGHACFNAVCWGGFVVDPDASVVALVLAAGPPPEELIGRFPVWCFFLLLLIESRVCHYVIARIF